jgi:small subunit ribosomal protein S18
MSAESADSADAVAGDEEGDEDGDDAFSAPSEYQERERGDRSRPGSDIRVDDINFKNISLLSRFLDRRGRIMSRRKTRVSAKVQRRVVREIKRARHLALLPYTADQTRQVRRRR